MILRLEILQNAVDDLCRLGWLDAERIPQPADNLQAGVISTFFELGEVAAADLGFVREIVLRQPLRVPKAAQVRSEHLAQVHARSEAICSKSTPRYTEQSDREAFYEG
jgi:hypothetical protein